MNVKIAIKFLIGFILMGMACFLNADELANKMPPLEKSFIKIMNKAIDEFVATTNEVKKTKIQLHLQNSLSNLLKDRVAKNWVGEVISIRSDDSDGSARITVGLLIKYGKAIAVTTLDNKAFDDKYHTHTGIDIETNLYNAVSELEIGDKVVFSGQFILSQPTLLIQDSLGLSGFKFTSIRKINDDKKSK
ncbi:hypothetical protein [Helicobacter cappadocius]|uniref:DUF5666 domain-containing protein n=1 Tax=Helicobacter cappadocius TaxID=3063998 RepID=A0AA90PPF7_9HELI|nr:MULTISPECIES: hypothetical protein [unclassified Helicobacter]MDO7252344.1 hypothetical protein [Helicobacter sp. faydin-H75]MDP2538211.1 hypothetical protein [Helicobacter sp. faydin-H76]